LVDFFAIIEEMRRRSYLAELELIIISAIMRLGDDAYGVPICREIQQCCGRAVTYGSAYAALNRLEEKGLVSSELSDPAPQRGGRAKKYFRVTAKGLRQFRQSHQALVRLWRGIPNLAREVV
jgi:DNA-binding PadR family transcriptional regulator